MSSVTSQVQTVPMNNAMNNVLNRPQLLDSNIQTLSNQLQNACSVPLQNMLPLQQQQSEDNFYVMGHAIPKKYVIIVAVVLLVGAGYYYKMIYLKQKESKDKDKEKDSKDDKEDIPKQLHLQQLHQQLQQAQLATQHAQQIQNPDMIFDIPEYNSKQ
jgi:mRNA deadenylase 3'-5' endonuclease subunit Ccr4